MNLENDTATTPLPNYGIASMSVSDLEKSSKVLTQDELARWWPFTRLDPKRFPKAKKHDPLEGASEAPF